LTSITVAPNSAILDIGEKVQFTATAHYSDGTSQPVSPVWGSNNASVISVSSTGLATGLKAGPASITATYQGKNAYSTVNVIANLTSIKVTPDTKQINVGESVQLTATAYYSDGSTSIVTGQSSFSGSNTIASVSASGLVTGLNAGSTSITATYQGISDAMTVTVIQPGPVDKDYDGVLNEHDNMPDIPNSENAVAIIGDGNGDDNEDWIRAMHNGVLVKGSNTVYPIPQMYLAYRDVGKGNYEATVMQCPGSMFFSAEPSYPYCVSITEREWAEQYIRYLPAEMKTKIEAGAQ
jgi:hypothetical protein